MKSGFVSIIGRPSSGKSTLVNALCGHKVSIVSSVPQTTRNRVKGVLTEGDNQLVFLDTPGYHISEKSFNKSLNEIATTALDEADVIMYVVDITRAVGDEEKAIVSLLKRVKQKIVIVFNKIDLESAFRNDFVVLLTEELKATNFVEVSALNNKGLEELKKSLYDSVEESPKFYPDEFYTDQDPEFRIAEIIREKVINRVSDEIPHSLYVEISDLEHKPETDLLWIRAFIVVERDSQKGIIIGKNGEKLKLIREAAKKEIKACFPHKISLNLMVKSNSKWKSNKTILKNIFK